MGRVQIAIEEDVRDKLRSRKDETDETYTEYIQRLLQAEEGDT